MKQSEKSKREQGERKSASVYDFIYHDPRRIASFLSQFDSAGVLTQITQAATIRKDHQESGTTDGQLGIPGAAKLGATLVETTMSSHGKDSQRFYDPTWANAITFLDHLETNDLLGRELATARIGGFVLVSGFLSIADLHLMEKTWRLPAVRKLMADGATNQIKMPDIPKGQRNNPQLLAAKKAVEEAAKSAKTGMELFFDLITILPHTIQARISGDVSVWCTLAEGGMTFDAGDLSLKYGKYIPGTWSVVGILDAAPDDIETKAPTPDFGDGAEMAVKMTGILAPITRNFLGRPADHYGITPLVIFREVNSPGGPAVSE